MNRRGWHSAMALAWALAAAAWLLSGCGDVPTAPPSDESVFDDAAATQGSAQMSAFAPDREGPRGVNIGAIRAERNGDGAGIVPDVGRSTPTSVPEVLVRGRGDVQSRYALGTSRI